MADSASSVTVDSPSSTLGEGGTSMTSNTSASSFAIQQQQRKEQQQPSSERSGKNSVQWAEKIADGTTEFATKTAEHISTGVTQVVGWTYENTKMESRGLRPMHVRVSVRVHHVSFLHPGLDSGSRTTIRDTAKGGRWRFGKKQRHTKDQGPPGLLKFGKRSGSWKNTAVGGSNHQLKEAAKIVPWNRSHEEVSTDPSDVAEIVNAEAFRLSRDGIIQQHYALEHAVPKAQAQHQSPRRKSPSPGRFSVPQVPMHLSPTLAGSVNPSPYSPVSPSTSTTESIQSNPYSAMLSPESLADPEGAARYYKECAARPKGYRRLVVSSLPQRNDVSIPSPPKNKSFVQHNLSSSALGMPVSRSSGGLGGESSFSFETNASLKAGQANNNNDRPEKKNGNLSEGKNSTSNGSENDYHNFDNVEYRYVGPPNTGPEFFQLLRKHGAATFGRYLPELACSVPNHSYHFELVKSKRRAASTQPIVYECPHVIWGDARDKMLSRIAKEGCPLIDGRPFEYASNSSLDDAQLSESLLLCGSTIWVKRAKDGDNDKGDQLENRNKKKLVEAEYHVSKFVDGVKDGISSGVKGVNVGAKAAVKGAQGVVDAVGKTAHDVAEVGKKSLASAKDKSGEKEKKKSKLRSMFPSKKRKQKSTGDGDGMSVDDSLVSGQDDYSIASEKFVVPSLQLSDHIETDVGEENEDNEEEEVEEQVNSSAEVKSSPYVLLLDDVIHIRIVSFPDKHEIARFPISVASVMVQRSMEDRMNDPFKPSEMTCNFIQEPSAPELRWGVTLKVTVRAVQVKPNKVSRMLMSPKINEKLSAGKAELKRFKEKMKSLGKNEDEINEGMKKREEEINREESELDETIKTYGYGKNDDDNGPSREIRLRQMFYCEREHESIIRKSLRRQPLNEVEMKLISDASLDPSSTKKTYKQDELAELLRLLDIHFPCIEEDRFVTKVRKSITSSLAPSASGSEETISLPGDEEPEPSANDVFASVSLAMAKSLEKCFEDDVGVTTTVQALEKQILTASTMKRKKLDAKTSKAWVARMSNKLSSCLNDGTTMSKVQRILLESVMIDDADGLEEEMKMDEDQIAFSESEESAVDVIELADWITNVASKLEECAIELEALYSPSELDLSKHSSATDNEKTEENCDEELDAKPLNPPPPPTIKGLAPTILSMSPKLTSDDNMLEGMITRRLSGNKTSQRLFTSTTISTIDQALPQSSRISASKADELLSKMKNAHLMKKKSSGHAGNKKWLSILDELETQKEKEGVDSVKLQYGFYVLLVIIAFSLAWVQSFFGDKFSSS